MPCYSPLEGWKARYVNPSGKRGVVFSKRDGFSDLPVKVACGQCIGCRLERSRQWAMRCVHEAQLYDENCFATLTYRDEDLPEGGTLVKKHQQDFIKRLREHVRRRGGDRLSFFACGEYGDQLGRPHYHVLLFNYNFPDQKFFKSSVDGSHIFTSGLLEELWPFGFATVGSLTFESAAYCARYAVKKMTGRLAARHYERVCAETGEIFSLLPEYVTMSLKPAIGKQWFAKFSGDVFPSDSVVSRGKEMKPPKYYDRLHEAVDAVAHERVRLARIKKSVPHKADQSPERLRVRREVKEAQIQFLKRELK